MKRVLFVATVTIHINSFHIPYLKYFKEKGYEVHVASYGDEKIEYCDKHFNLPFQRFPFKKDNVKVYNKLKEIMNDNEYEFVHCHTPVGGILARLAARKTRKNIGTKVIYTAHGFHFYKGAPIKNWLIYYPIEKMMSKYTDCLITINNEDYQLAKKKFKTKEIRHIHGVGCNTDRLDIQINDEEKQNLKNELQINNNSIVFSYIAELNNNKNQIMLINTVKKIINKNIDVSLLLIGNGPLKEKYQKIINDNNLQANIKLLGIRNDIARILSITDIYLASSKREGLPVNIMEAMYMGLPIIATDNRGHRELIKNDENGYIVHDENEMYNRIMEVINDKEKVSNFSTITKALVMPYLIANVKNEMIDVYENDNKLIRVLHVIGSMNMGGAENFLMNVYRNIDRSKIQFDFIVHNNGVFDDEIKQLGGKIFKLDYINKVGPFEYKRQLKEFFVDHPEYKMIHSHVDQTSGIILETAYKAGIPIRISHSHSTSNLNNIFIKLYKKCLQKKLNKYSNCKLACGNDAGKWLYGKNEYTVINNGIDIDKFKYNEQSREKIRKQYNINENDYVIGHVGRFSEVKNHKFLLELFIVYQNNNPQSKLLLVGDGELKETIIKQVNDYMIADKVIFAGNVLNVNEFYSAMDIFVFPSLYEGIPLTLIEAQVNGLPLIVSDSITKEVYISDNIFPLKNFDISDWLNIFNNEVLKKRNTVIKCNDYSIIDVCEKLNNIYNELNHLYIKKWFKRY